MYSYILIILNFVNKKWVVIHISSLASVTVDTLKNNLNKITAIIAFVFLINSVIDLCNCIHYSTIDLTGFAVPYIIVCSIIIIVISVITIRMSLAGNYNKITRILAITTAILFVISIVSYFSIYNSEYTIAKKIHKESQVKSFTDFISSKSVSLDSRLARANRVLEIGSFPPLPFYTTHQNNVFFPRELTEEHGYYLNFIFITIEFLFFAQYYFRYFDTEATLDKIDILEKEDV